MPDAPACRKVNAQGGISSNNVNYRIGQLNEVLTGKSASFYKLLFLE